MNNEPKKTNYTRWALVLSFILALVFLFLVFDSEEKDGHFEITKDGVVLEVSERDLTDKATDLMRQVRSLEELREQDIIKENKILRDSIDKLIYERRSDISTANDLAKRFSLYHDDPDKKPELVKELFNFLSKIENPNIDEDYAAIGQSYAFSFLNGERKNIDKQLLAFKEQVEALTKEKNRLFSALSIEHAHVSSLEKELKLLKEQLQSLVLENQNNLSNSSELQDVVSTLNDKISQIEIELDAYKNKINENAMVIKGHSLNLLSDRKIKITPNTGGVYKIRNSVSLTIIIDFEVELLKDTSLMVIYAACKAPNGKVIDTKPIHIKGQLIQYSQSITIDKSKLKGLNCIFQFNEGFSYGSYDIYFYTDYSVKPLYKVPIELEKF